ncbi:MAG: LysR family transcriptional regulator [Rhizobiales bacterium]|nr:LysR family transcriptional regulator [Hyphomicrobiales bacterium]
MKRNNDELDLNLLRVFFAIWDLRSLTAAGDRLGLTQPAISHALRRLRERFGDPLFVRVANRMLPTDAAVRLHEPLDLAFELLNRTLQSGVAFDASATERTFRIAMSDIAEFHLPTIGQRAIENFALCPRPYRSSYPPEPGELHAIGRDDLAIGAISISDKDLTSIDIMKDRYVCLTRASHAVAKSKLTRAHISQLRFFFARTTSSVHQLVEQALAEETGNLQHRGPWALHRGA